MAAPIRGMLTVDALKVAVENGAIETVICAVCDMQGRLVGKRVTGEHFVDHCLQHGAHICTYLLGTTMEMETPGGYEVLTWESGYGDYQTRPDWSTLRLIPWLEKTALVLADAVDETTGELVPIAPRTVLRRQIERCAALGFRPRMASELEFYLLRESYETAHAQGFDRLTPFGPYNEDYQLLQATRAEFIYRPFRQGLSGAGIPVEFTKGEAAPGQHEINIHVGDALESADRHALLKHGCKEIAHGLGHAITFMAKPDHTWTGNSGHIHLSLWDASGATNLFHDPTGDRAAMSATMRHFLGGMMAAAHELSLMAAPNVNSYKRYAAASWAPVNILWARDNRTCAFRVVGHGGGLRIENRLPGGDTNPYLAYAAVLAAGLHGIAHAIEPPTEFRGNGYLVTDAPRVPRTLSGAIDAFAGSAIARAAFGDTVVNHYLNAGRIEQSAFDMAVTDWERKRYLERG